MRQQAPLVVALVSLTIAAAACGDARKAPTSPGSDYAQGESGSSPDLKVTAPTPLSPVGGKEVDDDDPDLVIQNAQAAFSDKAPLSYVFEVLEGDRVVYRSRPVAGGKGRTSHEVGVSLGSGRRFTWRAYATYQGVNGPISSSAGFKTQSNRYGKSCAALGDELAIVKCRRAQFGFLSKPSRVEFLRRVAYDLNKARAEHAPYGILVKAGGNNCSGYACDIICSNDGRHRQWDVLRDEDRGQVPVWKSLNQLVVRPCRAVR